MSCRLPRTTGGGLRRGAHHHRHAVQGPPSARRGSTRRRVGATRRSDIADFDLAPDRSVHRWSFTVDDGRAARGSRSTPTTPAGADSGADDESATGDRGGRRGAAPPLPMPRRPQRPVRPCSCGHGVRDVRARGAREGGLRARRSSTSDLDGPSAARPRAAGSTWPTLAPDGRGRIRLLVDGLAGHHRDAARTRSSTAGAWRDLAVGDRLDELGFDMRVGDGGSAPLVQDIGRLVVDHLARGTRCWPWAEGLAEGAIDVELAGYLTGSIDLVARVRTAPWRPVRRRRLQDEPAGPPGGPAGTDAYGPVPAWSTPWPSTTTRCRPCCTPSPCTATSGGVRRSTGTATRVGGAAYLFVRGMTGPDVPVTGGQPHGVFTWELPPDLVVGLSDLLAGRPSPECRAMTRGRRRPWSTERVDGVLAPVRRGRPGRSVRGPAGGGGRDGLRPTRRTTNCSPWPWWPGPPGSDTSASNSTRCDDRSSPARTTRGRSWTCRFPTSDPGPGPWHRVRLWPTPVGPDDDPLRPLVWDGGPPLPPAVLVLRARRGRQISAAAGPHRDGADGPSRTRRGRRARRAVPSRGARRGPDLQRLAARRALTCPVTVIAGGPGTGKTHTVARILAAALLRRPRDGASRPAWRWPRRPARPPDA